METVGTGKQLEKTTGRNGAGELSRFLELLAIKGYDRPN